MRTYKLVLVALGVILYVGVVVGHGTKRVIKEDKISPEDDEKNNTLPEDHRFFLQEIFNKYGHGGVMSYEGFEHLLENLGLGRLAFDKSHNVSVHRVNGSFQEVHHSLDLHQHEHLEQNSSSSRRKRSVHQEKAEYEDDLDQIAIEHQENEPPNLQSLHPPRRCLSPQDILVTYGLEPHHSVVISPVKFLHMCPVIVYELDQRSCYHDDDEQQTRGRWSTPNTSVHYSAWLYATFSVTVISLIGLLGVAIVPFLQKSFYQQLLHFLVALAAGTLCGDALMHLLPHALATKSASYDHTTSVLRAAVTFLALTAFFFLEAALHHIRSMEHKSTTVDVIDTGRDKISEIHKLTVQEEPSSVVATESQNTSHHGHSHGIPRGQTAISSMAWMIIMGDGIHNLTDGLAIGASFSSDIVAGFSTSIAVFFHELPHELGDFAVLLKSGMSIKHALLYNIFSSVLSFLGMAIGVWIGEHDAAAQWIYAATGGTFLYIALTDLIPELNRYTARSKSFADIFLHVAGILSGGAIMLTIAIYEESLESLFN